VPDYSDLIRFLGEDFDPEASAGRFNRRLAVAVLVPEYDWPPYGSHEDAIGEAVRQRAGAWLLEEDQTLGRPKAVNGSIGRGAEGWIPIVEWGASAIGEGAIDLLIAAAAAEIIRRLRRRPEGQREEASKAPAFFISRGMAAAVAADAVAREFGSDGALEVEAVEEPSSIAGIPISEISYVGFEPWIVLLRHIGRRSRYVVVVEPAGGISGLIESPLSEWEVLFFHPGT
jgi:hypothetical protein